MEIDYKPFVDRMIFRYEGGYGWSPQDPGGPTNLGITCWDLAESMHQRMDSMAHWAPIVRAMTLTTAEEIYATKYATACRFNELGAGKDCVVFDTGVNSGPSRGNKIAQRVVGVLQDGIIGEITLKAINDADAHAFINQYCDERLIFLRSLHTWPTFGRGWSARVADLRVYSLNVAFPTKHVPSTPYVDKLELIPKAFAKAYDPEDHPVP